MWVNLHVGFLLNTTVLYDLLLVESADVEPWIWRADCKVTHGFLTVWGVCPPHTCIIQGSAVVVILS